MSEHQKPAVVPATRQDPARTLAGRAALALGFIAFLALTAHDPSGGVFFGGLSLVCLLYTYAGTIARTLHSLKPPAAATEEGIPATIASIQQSALDAGGGAYLATRRDRLIFAPPTAAVLVLAGPRAGKTSCVVIPALAAHPGPAIATSTKPEVLTATLPARQQNGQAWFLDLQGSGAPAGTRPLRWSPVTRGGEWQDAQLLAEAMTGASIHTADGAHWTERASALLACCLHAAARSGQGTRELSGWILRHDTGTPLAELPPDSIATDVLLGIKHTADRGRSGIFSTTARVLRAYRSNIALAASENPNFHPDQFVTSHDSVNFFEWAHQHWSGPRWSVALDPSQLAPK